MVSDRVKEIKRVFEGLQTVYHTYLPKADPILIHDLLLRQQKNPKVEPIYVVEIYTKPNIDSEVIKNYLIEKTGGMIPAIYENGTHYVTNQRLTLEILEEMCKSGDVLEVAGEYTGGIGGWGASHEHREDCPIYK
jgi:hypothetical protein